VLAYRNPEVVHRFRETWDVTAAEARALFDDLKRYLWLIAEPGLERTSPVPIVDEMWHTFVVYTVDYREFTVRSFGAFLDHVPTAHAVKVRAARNAQRAPARSREAIERRLVEEVTAVYDHLGAAVARRWYAVYPERYGDAFFATRRRAPAVAASARSGRRTGS
jgi:hypothetical protein